MKKYSEEVQLLLKKVYTDCMNEDSSVRERQLREWRRLKLLWEGFTRVWYSEVAHDWRVWDQEQDENTDQAYYDKPINVFKAYLESIIAALSVTVPPIKCFPDNADDTLDLATCKAGDKIAQLIYRHNEAALLWLHALFVSVTEGMTACYSYPVSDKKYGTYEEKEYDEAEEEHEITECPHCGYTIDDKNLALAPPSQPNTMQPPPSPEMSGGNEMGMQQATPFPNQLPSGPQSPPSPDQQLQDPNSPLAKEIRSQESDEYMPDSGDVELHVSMNAGQDLCPACMLQMDPAIKREKLIVTRLVGIINKPKARICLEVYGGLYIKIPNYAKKQKDIPYLIYSHECDYSMAMEKYENVRGKKDKLLDKIKGGNQSGSYSQYAQWARLSPQYNGEYPINVVTINQAWLRPAKFNILSEEEAKKLKKLFPDGCKVTYVNDEYACAENECLDDCWTLTENPLAEFLHFQPLGATLTSIQDITNDLISLILQTIEHGIGQTFADPGVLNFNAYGQTEATPGGIFPATPKTGKSLTEGFHEMRTATLSSEVLPFFQQVQSLGQLESGALPSLFGGNMEGTETASQYSMSRAQALQRLQNNWKVITAWWKNIFGKVIPLYIKEVKNSDDERDVQRDSDGNFVNVMIRKAELEGKIGKIELDANENLPQSWAQVKDTVEKLMANPNPEMVKIIAAPENAALIHDALGLVDFYVPGEDDIIKQYDEIKLLLASTPIPTGDELNPEMPSVEVDPIFDNHSIEFEICRKWIISEAGRQTKADNEAGYRNVLLHGKAHFQVIQQQQMAQMQAQQAQQPQPDKGATSGEKPTETSQEAPIMGESNVATIQ